MLRALYRVSTSVQHHFESPNGLPSPPPVSPRWLRVGSCAFAIFPSVDCWPWFVAAFERSFRSRSLCYSLGCIVRLLRLRPRSVWGWGGGREGGGRGGRAAHSAEKESASWLFLFVFVLHFFLLSEFFSLLVFVSSFVFLPAVARALPPIPRPPPPRPPRPPDRPPPQAHTHMYRAKSSLFRDCSPFLLHWGGEGEPGLPSPPPTAPRPDILCILFCMIGGVWMIWCHTRRGRLHQKNFLSSRGICTVLVR